MPGHAGAADADRIADRAAVAEHIKELSRAGGDHDGAGLIAAKSNELAARLRQLRREQRDDDRKRCKEAADHFSTITGVPTSTRL